MVTNYVEIKLIKENMHAIKSERIRKKREMHALTKQSWK